MAGAWQDSGMAAGTAVGKAAGRDVSRSLPHFVSALLGKGASLKELLQRSKMWQGWRERGQRCLSQHHRATSAGVGSRCRAAQPLRVAAGNAGRAVIKPMMPCGRQLALLPRRQVAAVSTPAEAAATDGAASGAASLNVTICLQWLARRAPAGAFAAGRRILSTALSEETGRRAEPRAAETVWCAIRG